MKFNKILPALFIFSCLFVNCCFAQNETPVDITEHSSVNQSPPPAINSSESEKPSSTGSKTDNPASSVASTEEKTDEKEKNIVKIIKNEEKVQNKKIEQNEEKKEKKSEIKEKTLNSLEKNENNEVSSASINNYLPETVSEIPENLNSNKIGIENAHKKEYIIRGIISMILVIAGAILLVIVIITGVNGTKISKKARRVKRKNKSLDEKGG